MRILFFIFIYPVVAKASNLGQTQDEPQVGQLHPKIALANDIPVATVDKFKQLIMNYADKEDVEACLDSLKSVEAACSVPLSSFYFTKFLVQISDLFLISRLCCIFYSTT